MAELRILDCPECGEQIPVKVTIGDGDETGFPISVMRADYLAAQLEHDLRMGLSHDRP
jgi:hypothetical protein